MDFYIIKSPSRGTIDILMRRKGSNSKELPLYGVDAVGLVQGRMIERVVASDIAERPPALRWRTSRAVARRT